MDRGQGGSGRINPGPMDVAPARHGVASMNGDSLSVVRSNSSSRANPPSRMRVAWAPSRPWQSRPSSMSCVVRASRRPWVDDRGISLCCAKQLEQQSHPPVTPTRRLGSLTPLAVSPRHLLLLLRRPGPPLRPLAVITLPLSRVVWASFAPLGSHYLPPSRIVWAVLRPHPPTFTTFIRRPGTPTPLTHFTFPLPPLLSQGVHSHPLCIAGHLPPSAISPQWRAGLAN